MKALFLVLIGAFVCRATVAQNSSVTIFTGWPFLNNGEFLMNGTTNVKGTNAYGQPYSAKYTLHSTNHIGIKLEQNKTNNRGFGFEYTFAQSVVSTINSGNIYREEFSKHRFVFRFSKIQKVREKLTTYACAGVGIKLFYANKHLNYYYERGNLSELLPIAFKMSFGFNYPLANNINLNIESGLGGPLLQAGISFKY
ncbi:MAG: hypothetical protein ABL940_00100 [Bacteroidia bacterium]